MKTMKLKSILSLLLLTAITFTACKKDKPGPPPEETIVGSWVGKYGGHANVPPPHPFRFNILPNGVIELTDLNKKVEGTGTWKLTGNKITTIYKYGKNYYNFKGNYNVKDKKITGTQGEDDDDQNTFFLNKE